MSWRTKRDLWVPTTDGGEAELPAGTVLEEETLEHQIYHDFGAYKIGDTGGLIHDDDIEWIEDGQEDIRPTS